MIVVYLLLALLFLFLAGGGLGVLLYRTARRRSRGGAVPWLAGGLGCLTGVLLAACLLVLLTGAYLTGVGLVHRDRTLAEVTLGPFEPRLTRVPEGPTPEPGGAGLADSLLPAEQQALASMQTLPRYTLDVAVDWPRATLTGREQVLYTNTASDALDQIVLRLFPNAPYYAEGSLTVGGVAAGGRPTGAELQGDGTVLVVELPEPLSPGAGVVVSLDLTVTVPHRQDRFGVYQDVMALGQWYPMLSVYDDEGWHTDPFIANGDPFYSATGLFTVTLAVPDGTVVASSGVETGRTRLDNGDWAVTVHAAAVREVAVVLSPAFKRADARVDGTTVTSYFLAGDEEAGLEALNVAARSIQVFNDAFGNYPYASLDVVESHFLIEGSPGGMEYPGLVLISSALYDQEGSFAQTGTTEMVWAHEVAHQWWYGVVGNDQVDDPWLDEALATYSSILYFESTSGRKAADSQLMWQCTLPSQAIRVGGGDQPVGTSLPAFGNNAIAYSAVVYGKGCLFFEKLRELLGHERFLEMLRNYYSVHKFGIVQPEDMHQAILTAASPDRVPDAEKLYSDWILGR